MPTIQQPRRAPEYVNGKQNVVLGVAQAQLYAVSWVDGEGQKSMALVIQFGKDIEDGGPGVFVMADETEMSSQLKLANQTIKKGLRAYLARQQEPTAEEVPDAASMVPTKVDIGRMDGPPSAGKVDLDKLDLG